MKQKSSIFDDGKILPLVEDFYTIQGEGFHTGKPAYFIRIGGCDVCCNWCDVKISWNPQFHPAVETDKIIKKALQTPAKAVVVTGGEPFIYQLDYLCSELKKNGFSTFVETSGSHPHSGDWDWICLSPKKNKPPLDANFPLANELKVIIEKDLDFSWAEENSKKVSPDCKLFLQPEWSAYEEIIAKVAEYVMLHPHWNISLQSHKFMHIP